MTEGQQVSAAGQESADGFFQLQDVEWDEPFPRVLVDALLLYCPSWSDYYKVRSQEEPGHTIVTHALRSHEECESNQGEGGYNDDCNGDTDNQAKDNEDTYQNGCIYDSNCS